MSYNGFGLRRLLGIESLPVLQLGSVYSATCVSRRRCIYATRLKIGAMRPGCREAQRKLARCVGIR
jgi:hypothetical protein